MSGEPWPKQKQNLRPVQFWPVLIVLQALMKLEIVLIVIFLRKYFSLELSQSERLVWIPNFGIRMIKNLKVKWIANDFTIHGP